MDLLNRITEALLEHDTLTNEQIMVLFDGKKLVAKPLPVPPVEEVAVEDIPFKEVKEEPKA